jgi:hypothetical protein
MNLDQLVRKVSKLESELRVLREVMADEGLIMIWDDHIKKPKLVGRYIAEGKSKPVYQMDGGGMIEYF